MDSYNFSSRSPLASHSFGEVLTKRAGIFERAPRIKIGDQYYRVVRVVGGQYEAPISNPRELEKATRIGKVYFSAHKNFVGTSSDLAGKKIQYANQEGIRYEDGSFVRNDQVQLKRDDAMDYLKATDNFEWQEKVIDFEQGLDTMPPTDLFQGQTPSYLHPITTRTGNRGPYTVQQVKEFLLEYTQNKLSSAHEIYAMVYSSPEEQENQRYSQSQRIESFPANATEAIRESRRYFQAGHLTTDNVWQMMVRTMQPAEYRLLPEEEPLADHRSPLPALQPPSLVIKGLEVQRVQEEPLPPSLELKGTFQIPATGRGHNVRSPSSSFSEDEKSVIVPFGDPDASQRFEQRNLSPISKGVQGGYTRTPSRRLEFDEQEDFRAGAELYLQLRLVTTNDDAHEQENRAATQAACYSAHRKMERYADLAEYTTTELRAIRQVIQYRESAGGFGLLPAGAKYRSVSESLVFYARIGLIQ